MNDDESHIDTVLKELNLDPVKELAEIQKELKDDFDDADVETKLAAKKVRIDVLKHLQNAQDKGKPKAGQGNIIISVPDHFDEETGAAVWVKTKGNTIGSS